MNFAYKIENIFHALFKFFTLHMGLYYIHMFSDVTIILLYVNMIVVMKYFYCMLLLLWWFDFTPLITIHYYCICDDITLATSWGIVIATKSVGKMTEFDPKNSLISECMERVTLCSQTNNMAEGKHVRFLWVPSDQDIHCCKLWLPSQFWRTRHFTQLADF